MTTQLSARYCDTCASDFLLDGHTREGETLLLASPGQGVLDTAEDMLESLDWDCGIPEVTNEAILVAIMDALTNVDLSVGADAEDVYHYVVLTWE